MASKRLGHPQMAAVLAIVWALFAPLETAAAARPEEAAANEAPAPKPATRPVKSTPIPAQPTKPGPTNTQTQKSQADRLARINAARSWGYQLAGLTVAEAARSPFDLLVVDATLGHDAGRPFEPAEVSLLKKKADGSSRLVLSYLSIGEAEDYRAQYFAPEFLSEDPPDWLGPENPKWRGNRLVYFCREGWQRTIIGDDQGRSLYNSIDPSPLQRLLELGFDGVYLDRADVYSEVKDKCPDAERQMVEFIARIATQARKQNPDFLIILQNAEELVRHPKLLATIDAIAKEDLFYSTDPIDQPIPPATVNSALGHLKAVKTSGRPVFVVDYVNAPDKKADARKRIEQQGFVPYIGPRDLGRLWLPGKDY